MAASALTTVAALFLALVCLGVSPSRTQTPSSTPSLTPSSTPYPSGALSACGPGANIVNGTVVGAYGYGGWGSNAARCLGNRVTGYQSITSVTFTFDHSTGSSLQAAVVIIGGGNLIASADISALLPASGRAQVKGAFAYPVTLDSQATYFVAACVTGAGNSQYNLLATDGPAAAAFCYSSFENCLNAPNWGLSGLAVGTVIEGSCTDVPVEPSHTPSPTPMPSPSRTQTPTTTPSPTPSSTPYPSGALSACGPGANIVNGTVVGAYGYGGWGSNAARCLGNRVTGYQSISSVAFTFDHRTGSSLQAAVVIIGGGGNLIASADISALLPASGTAQVKATFAAAPVALDSQATYFVAACVTGAGDSQFNLLATDGPAAAAFCYSSFANCLNAPYWGLSGLAVGTVIEGSCPGASASPTPSPAPLTCTYPSLGNCSSPISLSNVTEAMVKSYLGDTIAASLGSSFSWSNGWNFVKSDPQQFFFSFTASEPAYKGWVSSRANDLALAIETTLSKYCYGSNPTDRDAYSTQICPPKPTPTPSA